jgi:hypothetical protein
MWHTAQSGAHFNTRQAMNIEKQMGRVLCFVFLGDFRALPYTRKSAIADKRVALPRALTNE